MPRYMSHLRDLRDLRDNATLHVTSSRSPNRLRRFPPPPRLNHISQLVLCLNPANSIRNPLYLEFLIDRSPMEGGGGGGTLSEVYQSARKLLLRARDGIEKLERFELAAYCSSSSSSSSFSSGPAMGIGLDSPPELAFAIKKDIGQIQSLCADMDRLWRSIGSSGQRDLWKRKVEQIAEEGDSLKESLDRLSARQQKRMEEAKERAELMQRAVYEYGQLAWSYATKTKFHMQNGDGEHVLRIFCDEAQAMQSARNSHIILEEAYATGVAVLSKYAEQRDRLKRAKGKLWIS